MGWRLATSCASTACASRSSLSPPHRRGSSPASPCDLDRQRAAECRRNIEWHPVGAGECCRADDDAAAVKPTRRERRTRLRGLRQFGLELLEISHFMPVFPSPPCGAFGELAFAIGIRARQSAIRHAGRKPRFLSNGPVETRADRLCQRACAQNASVDKKFITNVSRPMAAMSKIGTASYAHRQHRLRYEPMQERVIRKGRRVTRVFLFSVEICLISSTVAYGLRAGKAACGERCRCRFATRRRRLRGGRDRDRPCRDAT